MKDLIPYALTFLALCALIVWAHYRWRQRERPEFPPMPHAERLHHSTKRAGDDDWRPIDWQAMRERRV